MVNHFGLLFGDRDTRAYELKEFWIVFSPTVSFFRWLSQSVWNSPLCTKTIVAGARRRVERIMGMPASRGRSEQAKQDHWVGFFFYNEKVLFMFKMKQLRVLMPVGV